MKILAISLLSILCISGCVSRPVLDQQASAEIDKLNANIQSLTNEAAKSLEQGERIANEIKDMKEKISGGQIGPVEGAQSLNLLIAEGKEIYDRFQKARDEVKEAQHSVALLREQHGVPWWQIALNVGMGIATTLAGSKWIAARTGLRILAGAIEKGGSSIDIKTRARGAGNSAINSAARSVS